MPDAQAPNGSDAMASRVEALFTRSDGGYRFARWGRAIVPAVMGTDEASEGLILRGLGAVAEAVGLKIGERDPDFGANMLIFMVDSWPRLLEAEGIERLIPDVKNLVGVLGAAGANQYRIFDFDETGAIRLCISLYRIDDDLRRLPPEAFALGQAVMGALLWSDKAFLGESPTAVLEGGRVTVKPFYAGVIREAYALDLPPASIDPRHAARIAARLEAPGG